LGDAVLMSYTRLSKRPLLFRSFTGLEISEFNEIYTEIESRYNEHERKRLSRTEGKESRCWQTIQAERSQRKKDS
jgi:predicted transposase YdaD